MVNAFRYGILGAQPDVNIYLSFVMLFVFMIGLYMYCMMLLNKGVGIKQ